MKDNGKIGWGAAMLRGFKEREKEKIKAGKIMKVNSAVANKMLKKITEEYEALKVKEAHSKDFLASVNENPDSIRPKYDFGKTQSELYDYEEIIRIFNKNSIISIFGFYFFFIIQFISKWGFKDNYPLITNLKMSIFHFILFYNYI